MRNTPIPTPLEQLQDILRNDMADVNQAILKRMESPVSLIPQLAQYLIVAGGKRIRPLLTLASAKLHDADMTRAHGLAAAVEFIHSATLLHDDVVDESAERRGQTAANLVFGNQASVLVGDFLFSGAFELMTESNSIEVLKILSRASRIISEGEVLQLTTTNALDTSLDTYLNVIQGKTAALFEAACEIGPVIAGRDEEAQEAMASYGLNLGMAFQITDDVLDYNAERAKLGKTVGDDFREGKMTAPVIFALESADEEEQGFWQRTLGEKNQKDGDLEYAQSLIAKHGAIEKSENLAKTFGISAQQAIEKVPDHPQAIQQILHDLVDFTIHRSF